MKHKVSIIIPTHKRSDYLVRSIDSVLSQDYSNIEIVVIDDNDPSSLFRMDTEKKMQRYVDDDRIVYIKNERNLGGALARNAGICNATGSYITFLDDDDIYLGDKISKQLYFMLKDNLDMSFTDVRIHNEDDKLIDYREHSYVKSLVNVDLLKYHLMYHLTPTSTYMFKKELLIKVGSFDDISMGQEFRLMLKTLKTDAKVGYLPGSRIIQYVHSGERISVGTNKIKAEMELYNFKKQYFKILNRKEKNYIRFRHHLVLCVVGLRSKKYSIFLQNLVLILLTSPLNLLNETFSYRRKIKKNNVNIEQNSKVNL